jgi:tol-pal system protein YbgF
MSARPVLILTLAALFWLEAFAAEAPFRPHRPPSSGDSATATTPAVPPPPAADPTRSALADLLLQLESLQNEVRSLRGTIEVQAHEIEQLKRQNREALADMDRRLRELERRGAGGVPFPSAPGAGSPPPPVVPDTAAPAADAVRPPPAAAGAEQPPLGAAAGTTAAAEQAQYDAAFNLLKQGRYDQAAQAFRAFIAKYPNSGLAGNAQYWIGEAYYVTRNFRAAREEFAKVVEKYPASPKVPDALLKIGYSHYELGEWDKARAVLNEVLSRYPGTTVAKSAELRLAKMKKEGH